MLEKHSCIITRAERIQNSKNWILTANAEGPQQSLNQLPDFAQTKRECKRLHEEPLARTQQEYRAIPCNQQIRQRKRQHFEGNEDLDYVVDPKTSWRFYKQSRRNLQTTSSGSRANLQSASSSSQRGTKPGGRRAIGFLGILQALTGGDIFLRVRKSFGCLEQYTHKHSTYRVAQHDHFSSRGHAWLKSCKAQDCTSSCPQNICHPRVMSRSLPHLTLTTCTSSLSPISSTSPFLPTVSPSQNKPYDSQPVCILPWSTAECARWDLRRLRRATCVFVAHAERLLFFVLT